MKEGEEGKGERREDFTFVACFYRFIILFLLPKLRIGHGEWNEFWR